MISQSRKVNMLAASLIHVNTLQFLFAPMAPHENIVIGIDNYLISYNVPMRPIKMMFFEIAATLAHNERTTLKSNIFIIYLILIGLMGIMGFYNTDNCLEIPLTCPSWVLMGGSFNVRTVGPVVTK